MKKHLFLGIIGAVVFFNSCSSDDNDSPKKLLLSKATINYYDYSPNPIPEDIIYKYNNSGEVIKIESRFGSTIFEYSNGKILKSKYYTKEQQLESSSVYNYNGDQLVNIQYTSPNSADKSTVTYSYDANGKMIYSTHCESANCEYPTTSSMTYSGDNITSEINAFTFGKTAHKRELTYDNKLSPYTNLNKYLRITMGGAYGISANNYTTEVISNKDSAGNWKQGQRITYSIQYNSSQLPVQIIGTEANGKKYVQYNYEYITQ
ncbi:hypothetical protein [Chryseobacterium sp. c4a]|uniref:hypothetical protein n=1 Tax=Chryseobacterium sp. c4a TaxID=1573582 RepID=UPI00135749E5|nr:hypothetical protein [Chryseobacterium sp. c4a]